MMLLNRNSAIQSASRRFCIIYKLEKSGSLPAIRTTWYIVRTPNCPKHHPSGRWELSVRTFLCLEKLQTIPACIRPDISAAHLDDTQCSTNYRISFSWSVTVRTTGQHGNYFQLKYDSSDNRATSFGRGSNQERISAKLFESRSHSCPSGCTMTTVRTVARFYQAWRLVEPTAYK
jgi:hypothetical protein